MSPSSEVNMQNLLDAVTIALQQDEDIEPIMKSSSVPREEADPLIRLIQSLQSQLVQVEPSAKFATRLHSEVMGSRRGVVTTVRQMPARVHVAAILAVVAGFVLIGYRRLFGSGGQDITEETVAV